MGEVTIKYIVFNGMLISMFGIYLINMSNVADPSVWQYAVTYMLLLLLQSNGTPQRVQPYKPYMHV